MKNSLKRELRRHLRDTFGLTDYRPGQKEAVYTLLSGRDVMCILPTGAGKSLCWQLPAVVHGGLTLVVSPLIALMRDQVQHLMEIGVPAVSLDRLLSPEERQATMDAIRRGKARIVLVSPERLQQESFRRLCREVTPWLVVVDEAHCIVQWGGDFRPAYQQIGAFLRSLPSRPTLCALTATADPAMQRDICLQLEAPRMQRIILPHIRENLVYKVRTTLDSWGEIIRLCQREPCKTVIFCGTRASAEALADCLQRCGIPAAFYHAGQERGERLIAQERFRTGEIDVLCATSAFGMGVDIPDIRRVIHEQLPPDVIDYAQQSGRAGRDGQPAECILLLEPGDLLHKARIAARLDDGKWTHRFRVWRMKRRYWHKLEQEMRVLLTSRCIPSEMAAVLGRRIPLCGKCSACRNGRMLQRIPQFAGMKEWQIRLWFLRWQRMELARKRQCSPRQIMSDRILGIAAQKLAFPVEVQAPAELERLLAYFRGEWVHDLPDDGAC